MLSIPEEIKALFSSDVVHKNFHVHFPGGEFRDLNNDDIVSESVSFTESLCSQQYFKFGLAEASQIEFTAVGIPNVRGAYIECAIEIDCDRLGLTWAAEHPVDDTLDWLEPQTCMVEGELYYRVPYGRFKVDSCPRDHGAMYRRQITAYSDMPYQDLDVFSGSFPNTAQSVSVADWMTGIAVKEEDMVSGNVSYGDYTSLSHVMTKNDTSLSLYGVQASSTSFSIPIDKITAIRFGYDEHPFDEYAEALMDQALTVIPNVDQRWAYDDGTYRAVYKSVTEAFVAQTGKLKPCFSLYEYTEHPTTHVATNRASKPVFIKPGQTYIIDPETIEENFSFYTKMMSGHEVRFLNILVSIPSAWRNTASWVKWQSPADPVRTSIPNWPIADLFPEGQDIIWRSGVARSYPKMYYASYNRADLRIIGKIKSTLTYNEKRLGKYFEYSNAISVTELIKGLMEITGRFWKMKRDGEVSDFEMSENPTAITIPRSDWSEIWWDETPVEAIGRVKIIYNESGEEQEQTFNIGSGNSIYLMEDNELLANAEMDTETMQSILGTYFAPNAAMVNFTPADIEMRGLPYLESGDYIRLTAEDGTDVETYILCQTINGIQNLNAVITSTNGELLEVIDDE